MTDNHQQTRPEERERPFKITINQKPFEWSQPTISGAEIKSLYGSPAEFVVNQITPGPAEDPEIANDQKVDLSLRGAEKFTTRAPATGFGNEFPA
jgi:multiubiquitin